MKSRWPPAHDVRKLGRAWGNIGLRNGGGGSFEPPQREGGGGAFRKRGSRDRPVPRRWSKTSDDDSPTAPRSGPEDCFFKKNFPHDTSLKMISASRGIILSHVLWYLRTPPLSARRGVPVTGAQKGRGGVRERGSNDPPPPPRKPIFPQPRVGSIWAALIRWLNADATFFFGMVDCGSIACSDCPPFPGCRSASVLPTPALWHIHSDMTTANSGSVVLSRPKLGNVHILEFRDPKFGFSDPWQPPHQRAKKTLVAVWSVCSRGLQGPWWAELGMQATNTSHYPGCNVTKSQTQPRQGDAACAVLPSLLKRNGPTNGSGALT